MIFEIITELFKISKWLVLKLSGVSNLKWNSITHLFNTCIARLVV